MDDLGPSGRPDATGIPGSGTCKGKGMYVQGEEMVKTVGGDSRGGGVGTQGDEERVSFVELKRLCFPAPT